VIVLYRTYVRSKVALSVKFVINQEVVLEGRRKKRGILLQGPVREVRMVRDS
jgi:hypothetical protein